jgi:hypothetical protein
MDQRAAVGTRGQSNFTCHTTDRTYRKRRAILREGIDNSEGMKKLADFGTISHTRTFRR